jgi:hypothetical protein
MADNSDANCDPESVGCGCAVAAALVVAILLPLLAPDDASN